MRIGELVHIHEKNTMGIVLNSQTLCHFQVMIMEVVENCLLMHSDQTLFISPT